MTNKPVKKNLKIVNYTFKYPKGANEFFNQQNDQRSVREARIARLRDVAIYLEGFKKGNGSLAPLGSIHLESIWESIEELENINKQHETIKIKR